MKKLLFADLAAGSSNFDTSIPAPFTALWYSTRRRLRPFTNKRAMVHCVWALPETKKDRPEPIAIIGCVGLVWVHRVGALSEQPREVACFEPAQTRRAVVAARQVGIL